MKRLIFLELILLLFLILQVTGCDQKAQSNSVSGAPPPAQVEREDDSGAFQVKRPEDFFLAAAGKYTRVPELTVTGVVNPDVSRSVPAVSLASGRVVDIKARLGDTVEKG